jgi:ribA/ribD-fused uncharacterized protein
MQEQFIFYFSAESIFSHWYKCSFQIERQNFYCIDQYLMYKKALLFNDAEIANKILNSSDPKRHRYLGRDVKDFNKPVWQKHCMQFAYDANYANFIQNKNLKIALSETLGKPLAEASPYDRNWGIGVSMSNPMNQNRKNWRGKNWGGKVLESVRKNIF